MNPSESTSHSQSAPHLNFSDLMKNPNDLIDQIQVALTRIGYSQLSHVRCRAEGDEVTLSGQLDSFYLKQVAQSVAMKIPGVKKVKNEILVQ